MNQKYSILIFFLFIFFCLSTNLQAVEFYSKKGKLSLNLGKNWVKTSNIRLNEVNETFKKNNINLRFVDGFHYKLNHDVYIWIQVIKGNFEPDKMIKLMNIDQTTTKTVNKYSNKIKNINKQISSIKVGKTIWSDEHKAAIMKVHVKRGNNADLNGLSHFFFLENQITAIHCYSPSNFDQSKYYYDAMKTVAIDDNYVKDDNWYKIFYSILGLKFKKLKK